MNQQIRFCRVDGRRVAYATVGDGPPLVFGAHWVTHLEEEWAEPRARAFYEELARTHRVVRYDRLGTGLSERKLRGAPTMDLDVRSLEAVLDATTEGPAAVFALYCGGLATAVLASSQPDRFAKIVFFGGYAAREDIPEPTRRSLVDMVRFNWPLAAQMFAGLDVPHGSGDEIRAKTRYQLRSADADVAAGFLELDLTFDARPYLPDVTAPSLVLHRRGDRTVPIRHGRELASLLPNARFVALNGDASHPWVDDQRDLQRALAGFLGDDVTVELHGDSPLTHRETEVLRLVAVGLSNREIASSLVLSEHTVHRHVANILRKLSQSTRAAAAAHATRAGFI